MQSGVASVSIAHYENFPVASLLLPARFRGPVRLIYAFARCADDIADEGNCASGERMAQLDRMRSELDRIARKEVPQRPLFRDLAAIVSLHALPLAPFHDLLSAFRQDVLKQRYENFGEVIDYCSRSANSVGKLLLHLYGAHNAGNLAYSDAICSSLQLVNFLQDIAIDYKKGRVYLPRDEMARHGVSEAMIARGEQSAGWRELMALQIGRAQSMLDSGRPLGKILCGRIGLEMRVIVEGGQRILEKLRRSDGDVFSRRPVLRAGDWAIMLARAL
jgi:squalene synthase HpnC